METAIEYKNFWKYVAQSGLSRQQLMALSNENKRKFFLKWKHGMTNPASNEDFEDTAQYIRRIDKNAGIENKFEIYCDSIKNEIGFNINPMVQQIATKKVKEPNWDE